MCSLPPKRLFRRTRVLALLVLNVHQENRTNKMLIEENGWTIPTWNQKFFLSLDGNIEDSADLKGLDGDGSDDDKDATDHSVPDERGQPVSERADGQASLHLLQKID